MIQNICFVLFFVNFLFYLLMVLVVHSNVGAYVHAFG